MQVEGIFNSNLLTVYRKITGPVLLAMAAAAAASGARFALEPVLHGKSPFLLYTLAILVCAWYGGRTAGYLAVLFGALAATFFFEAPYYSFGIPSRESLAALLVFAGTGSGITWFVGHTHSLTARIHRREQELVEAYEGMTQVLESTSDAVYTLDRNWRITYLNTHAREQLQVTRDVLGENLWKAFPDLDQVEAGKALREALEKGISVQGTSYSPALGAWFEFRAYPANSGLAVYFRNISASKQAEDALRESEQRFRTLIEQASDGIFITDVDGKFTHVNGAACKLLGRKRQEVLGKKVFDVIPEEEHTRLRTAKQQLLQGQDLVSEWRVVRDDGTIIPVEASARMMPDGRLQAFARDITRRKEGEQALLASEKRFRGTFENAAVGMAHVSLSGRWLRVNQRLCDVVGYTREELLDRTFQEITHPADLAADLDELERLKNGEIPTYRMEKRYLHKEGHVVWVSLTVSLEREPHGLPMYCISIIQDITDRKRTEQELRIANDDLRQFAYAASHDLQEPLRMITSFSQLLERRYGDSIDEAGRQYIYYSVEGARRLDSLLHGLRAYWRASEHEIERPVRVPVQAVVNQALENLEALIKENGAVVSCGPLPEVVAEPTALVQVFQNLISNAVKYQHPERAPRIHVSGRFADGEWVFAVADNGIGVPEEYRKHIFGLFKRLHGFGKSGSGIGLALCQKVVERRGGRIWVESDNGPGSTFRFTLPVHPARRQPADVRPGAGAVTS